MKSYSFIFWDITQCSPFQVADVSEEHVCFVLVSCLAYSSTLKIKATCSFEMSVDFQRIIIIINYFNCKWVFTRWQWY
jgi:hypothetical protein